SAVLGGQGYGDRLAGAYVTELVNGEIKEPVLLIAVLERDGTGWKAIGPIILISPNGKTVELSDG
ncbi:MAG: hypothetical protein KDE20_29070, partial [Caldilineaceae bacterium]|nr:hypothetical protein [Caldilineaceae bacterium]